MAEIGTTHIAITPVNAAGTKWLEKVTDKEYGAGAVALPAEARRMTPCLPLPSGRSLKCILRRRAASGWRSRSSSSRRRRSGYCHHGHWHPGHPPGID